MLKMDFLLIEIPPFTLCGLSDVCLLGNGCELSYYMDLEAQVQWFVQALEKASTQVSREFKRRQQVFRNTLLRKMMRHIIPLRI